jgi:hypothetical protein
MMLKTTDQFAVQLEYQHVLFGVGPGCFHWRLKSFASGSS